MREESSFYFLFFLLFQFVYIYTIHGLCIKRCRKFPSDDDDDSVGFTNKCLEWQVKNVKLDQSLQYLWLPPNSIHWTFRSRKVKKHIGRIQISSIPFRLFKVNCQIYGSIGVSISRSTFSSHQFSLKEEKFVTCDSKNFSPFQNSSSLIYILFRFY